MKKIYVLIICCILILCGCKSDNENALFEEEISSLEEKISELKNENKDLTDKNKDLKNENKDLKNTNKDLKELANKYKVGYEEALSICYELLGEYEETETNNNKGNSDIEIIGPELPLEVSYIGYDGLKVTCRIDKISYTYDSGTDNLRLYFSGEKIYDKNGTESLEPGRLCAALYDENGNIVEKNNVTLSKIKTGEKFYDCDRIFLEVPSGHTYTLKIYNHD